MRKVYRHIHRQIPQRDKWRYDSFGNRKKGGRVHCEEWSEPADARKWIPITKQLPPKSARVIVKWADGFVGRAYFNKKAGVFDSGIRITHWSKSNSGAPEKKSR